MKLKFLLQSILFNIKFFPIYNIFFFREWNLSNKTHLYVISNISISKFESVSLKIYNICNKVLICAYCVFVGIYSTRQSFSSLEMMILLHRTKGIENQQQNVKTKNWKRYWRKMRSIAAFVATQKMSLI